MSLTELFGREPSMTPEARTAELNEHAARNERQFQKGLHFGTPMGMRKLEHVSNGYLHAPGAPTYTLVQTFNSSSIAPETVNEWAAALDKIDHAPVKLKEPVKGVMIGSIPRWLLTQMDPRELVEYDRELRMWQPFVWNGLTAAACLVLYSLIQRDDARVREQGLKLNPDQLEVAKLCWAWDVRRHKLDAEAARKAREPRVICQGDWIADEENF